MDHTAHNALRSLICVLLTLLVFTAGGSPGATGPAEDVAANVQGGDGAHAEISAVAFDARLPFLAGGSGLLAAPLELPTRLGDSGRTRTAETTREHAPTCLHTTILTALRLRIAGHEHAAVARVLADARAGREDAHNTPPPTSVS